MPRRSACVAALACAAIALTALAGCASAQSRFAYPGFDSPSHSLQTFFGSAKNLDYTTTYACYYAAYHGRVTESEFIGHRKQAAVLLGYQIGPVASTGTTAEATATLTFADRTNPKLTRHVDVREDLVDESGAWRIRVW